jgi:hypothetical protein
LLVTQTAKNAGTHQTFAVIESGPSSATTAASSRKADERAANHFQAGGSPSKISWVIAAQKCFADASMGGSSSDMYHQAVAILPCLSMRRRIMPTDLRCSRTETGTCPFNAG